MKLSENWLREWVNPAVDTNTLAEQLTMAGLEIDGLEPVAKAFNHVVVGEVVDVQPHPDADKLRVTQVNVGQDTPLQIVCGAPNVSVGMKAPTALIGATLPNGLTIKKSKLRGMESQGMLCGASEIDLPDVVDGLMALSDDAPVGMNIREWLDLDNTIFDIAITPNRGDCLSVRGVSREIGVINNLPVNVPNIATPTPTSDACIGVQVTTDDCPRYLAQLLLGVNSQVTTPEWLVKKLLASGLRSHSALVDVTNYVLLELGQPLHAFDADKIQGDICVRYADAGEKLQLLNEQEISLTGDELVIADNSGAIALAGIMGGLSTSVTDTTTNIVLESAFFAPLAIAGRARRYGLHTDASQRYERGVDFNLPELALNRAICLMQQIAGGNVGQITRVENVTALPKRPVVTLTQQQVTHKLGFEVSLENIVSILTQLDIHVEQTQQDNGNVLLTCTPPSHRFDIGIGDDLIEEVARIYGYDNIPSQLPLMPAVMAEVATGQDLLTLKHVLCQQGYDEAVSFSFSDAKLEALFDTPDLVQPLALANPISTDLAVMRRTLLSSLLPCVQYNLNRQQTRVRLFETGLRFIGDSVATLQQTPSLALVAVGNRYPEQWFDAKASHTVIDFFDFKHDVEQVLAINQLNTTYQPSQQPFLHPGQSADVLVDGKNIGWFGQLHPTLANSLDFPTIWVAQFDLSVILLTRTATVASPPRFPQVRRDIAILVDSNIAVQTLAQTITDTGGDLLQTQWLFDVYQGEHTGADKKSLAFALIWQDYNKTLSDDEVQAATDQVVAALEKQHNATLRVS